MQYENLPGRGRVYGLEESEQITDTEVPSTPQYYPNLNESVPFGSNFLNVQSLELVPIPRVDILSDGTYSMPSGQNNGGPVATPGGFVIPSGKDEGYGMNETQPIVTSNDVEDFFYRQQALITSDTYAIGDDKIKEQGEREKVLIYSTQTCPYRPLSTIQDKLGNLNSNSYKQLINDNFYNADAMKALMCVSESIVFSQPIKSGAVSSNERIRRWLKSLKQVGEKSVTGYALESDLDYSDDAFILKAPRKSHDVDILHEYFVGLHTNSLRGDVPNFAYVMGGFQCARPIIEDDGDVATWCMNTNNDVNYILYENITPAVTMRAYCKDCTFSEWLDKYLQILYALAVANEKIDFTHYDLHPGNVLIRDISVSSISTSSSSLSTGNKFSIPYNTERNGIEYVVTDGIATIIDYDTAHVQVDGVHYGRYNFETHGVQSDAKFPLYDAYKLLLGCMSVMRSNKNDDCFNGAAQILKYFNPYEDPVEVIRSQSEYYYFLPYLPRTKDVPIHNFTKFIRDHIGETNSIVVTSPVGQIIGCFAGNICITGENTLRLVGINSELRVSTAFDFYDIVSRLMEEGRTNDVQEILENFNYDESRDSAINEYNDLREDFNADQNEIIQVNINGQPLSTFLNIDNTRAYKEFVMDVATLYDTIQQISILEQAIVYMARFYDDDVVIDIMSQQKAGIQQSLDIINGLITKIQEDYDYVMFIRENRSRRRIIDSRTREKPELKWWWDSLPYIVNSLR